MQDMFDKLKQMFKSELYQRDDVINVTDLHAARIPLRPKHSSENVWWQRLEKPLAERQALRESEQLLKETKKLYIKLAEYIDGLFKKEGSSLYVYAKQQTGYYSNILYTIYCISEGVITSHYGDRRGYDPLFSYKILGQHLNETVIDNIKKLCERYSERLPEASPETIRFYRLTPTGHSYKWWDSDGVLRAKGVFDKTEQDILERSPYRSTIFWKNHYEFNQRILTLYLHAVHIASDSLNDSTYKWSTKQRRALSVLTGDRRGWSVDDETRLPKAFLKIAEQQVRLAARYAAPLNTKEEDLAISRIVPKALVPQIYQALHDDSISFSDEALDALRASYSQAWKVDAKDISGEESLALRLFMFYKGSLMRDKFMREVLRKQDNPRIQLLAFYYLGVESLKQTEQKLLEKLIHPQQMKAFKELISTEKPPTSELLDELLKLRHAPRRNIVLNSEKIATTRAKHDETVSKLNEYLGEDKDVGDNREQEAQSRETMTDLFAHSGEREDILFESYEVDFINLILENNCDLGMTSARAFSKQHNKMLGGLIQGINQKAYVSIDDQLILQVDDTITIEETYREFVRKACKL